MKCMKNEERRDIDHLPKDLGLEEAKILMRRRIFEKKRCLGQEKRERDWNVWVRGESSRISSIYRIKYLDISRRYWRQKSSIDRGGIELLLSYYWAYRNKVFQGGKTTWDECNQDRHQTKQQRSMLSTQTHQTNLDAKHS